MVNAIFDCANKLFGLKFVLRSDITSYHPDVATYEVYESVETVDDNGVVSTNDELIALFLHDNYSRQYKNGGAWMSEYRSQTRNIGDDPVYKTYLRKDGSVIPIIVNNNNFAKAPAGQQTLLSFDDARTLFHEFGHGLHGMLSNVYYNTLAGTAVLRDFVELPSQLYEHWLSEREVLSNHALHVTTNEPIPDTLIKKLEAARGFNSGYDTVSYLASALIDQELHALTAIPSNFDVNSFEGTKAIELGILPVVGFRHRPMHFSHIFSGSSYAAAYYVYLWAEVLDADGFEAFKETTSSGIFDPTIAKRLRKCIYSAGNSDEPGELYRQFRGRDPIIEPMLRKKSLV